MINLAPIRYARVLEKDGGPVARLEGARLDRKEGLLYQVAAYLSEGLNLETRMPSVFTQADGCGTHKALLVAQYMAISEALERWALYDLYQRGEHKESGLERDTTSTGMAAFPGLQSWQSARRARWEAMERYTLAQWATGKSSCQWLDTRRHGISGIELQSPFSGCRVVVVWGECSPGRFTYGFSGATSVSNALNKALIEMDRLSILLQQAQNYPRQLRLSAIENPLERRIIRFSTRSGHDDFLTHLVSTMHRQCRMTRPRPVVDNRLRGPWDRYTIVWRTLFPMPPEIYSDDTSLFYW